VGQGERLHVGIDHPAAAVGHAGLRNALPGDEFDPFPRPRPGRHPVDMGDIVIVAAVHELGQRQRQGLHGGDAGEHFRHREAQQQVVFGLRQGMAVPSADRDHGFEMKGLAVQQRAVDIPQDGADHRGGSGIRDSRPGG
jgi:hypothetical protein